MSKAGKRIIAGLKEATSLGPSLLSFQAESNKIEGIITVRTEEVVALQTFVSLKEISIDSLVDYVAVIQPNARLRRTPDIPGVRVSNHIAPASGQSLMDRLSDLLTKTNTGAISAFDAHCTYECLHPFTDGNGRSGRALWLWMNRGHAPLGFLHQFYYDTLSSSRLT